MNKSSSSPSYSSFRSLLQSKLKGYWRVQSLEKLKSQTHKGNQDIQRLIRKIERTACHDIPSFIQFTRCPLVTNYKLNTINQYNPFNITSNTSTNFFFTQTKKRISLENEQKQNSHLLLSIFGNNERELELFNSLPFFAFQNRKFCPRKFKEVVRDSRLLKNNTENFKKAVLYNLQMNMTTRTLMHISQSKQLQQSHQHLLLSELVSSASEAVQKTFIKCKRNEESKGNGNSNINMDSTIKNYNHKDKDKDNLLHNTLILFKKKKTITSEISKRNESSTNHLMKNRFLRNMVRVNKSISSVTRKTIQTKHRNTSDKFDDKLDIYTNSKDIKPSNMPFMKKDSINCKADRKTIAIKIKHK